MTDAKGSWVAMEEIPCAHDTKFRIYCSECKHRSDDNPTHFCSNCGADMRGEEDKVNIMNCGDSLARRKGYNEGVEKGRKLGQEEAWTLARRVLVEDFSTSEWVALKNALQLGGDVAIEKRIITRGSYADVAAMVEEFDG